LKILVYEHVSGGGFAEKPIPPSILCEGFGMLRTLTADLRAAGHSVTTSLDSRICIFQPLLEADHVTLISSPSQIQQVMKNARAADAACIIAPESNGTLESIVEEFEEEYVPLANGSSRTIAAVSSKDSMLEHVRKIGAAIPNSLTLNVYDDVVETSRVVAERIGFPAVLKPESDAGMAGLSKVNNKSEVKEAVDKIKRDSTSNRLIAQDYIEGVPASVSLISTGDAAAAISLNKQEVLISSGNASSRYDGGEVPLESELRPETMIMAKRVVESYSGLRGYVGVDFVLTKDGPVVIEVNPRLTTSYIGLREVVPFNPAQTVFDAALSHKLPSDTTINGCARFVKVQMAKMSANCLRATFKMNGVVSPPFPTSGDATAFALVSSNGATLQEAALRLKVTKRNLHNISRSGGT
jgi:predicted ATP-grasp superfamily ATP-dependent carboligase